MVHRETASFHRLDEVSEMLGGCHAIFDSEPAKRDIDGSQPFRSLANQSWWPSHEGERVSLA